jgi:hypothetical protein
MGGLIMHTDMPVSIYESDPSRTESIEGVPKIFKEDKLGYIPIF